MAPEIPWNWFRPGPERDAARARDKRRRQGLAAELLAKARAQRRGVTLAERNSEILRLWRDGVSGVEIAERFGLAKSTVSGIVAGLPSRRRYGDPEDVTWPYPRRFSPVRSIAPRPPRRFDKAGPPDPADVLGARVAAPKGSAHGRSVLDEAKVIEMRRLRSQELWTTGALARHFGVGRNTVCYALIGTTWGHVPGAIAPKRPGGRA